MLCVATHPQLQTNIFEIYEKSPKLGNFYEFFDMHFQTNLALIVCFSIQE